MVGERGVVEIGANYDGSKKDAGIVQYIPSKISDV
jgi:hypothetical protein